VEKIITFADVRAGDTIRAELGSATQEVRSVTRGTYTGAPICLKVKGTGVIGRYGHPETPIVLVHRPWQGATPGIAQELLIRDIEQRCAAIAALQGQGEVRFLESVFGELLERLLTYELGKYRDSGVSGDPVEAAVDASCGFLGGGPAVR